MGKKRQEAEAEAKQGAARLQCNKGKACRFKRSCFSKEGDAVSSAILLLACVVCAPRFHVAETSAFKKLMTKRKAKVYKGKGKAVYREDSRRYGTTCAL
ncbi:hypothetical protein BHM03_00002544 [Ensete ventricosum]|nr:hypothetical protein BHM03_00002544 [Ensete ventricosum]